MKLIENYRTIAASIEMLFSPQVEVVLHDLATNTINFIAGSTTNRKVGSPSHLSQADRALPAGGLGPYTKMGEDGEKQRSISIVLCNEDHHPAYMLCINFKVGELERAIQTLSTHITRHTNKALNEHFTESWQDKINTFIGDYLSKKSSSIKQLHRNEKKELVLELKKNGAFQGKHAAQYIANALKISRASIYSYIRQKD
ncbi:MAG: PAS domain-containing protein [Zetaproteobacteria bacterium]|nr:PAS domain-containing protein [Zetaproteobacteria bacterium]